jgi:hypothetical protein
VRDQKGAWLGALTTVTAIAFDPLLAALLVRFPPVPSMRSSFPFIVPEAQLCVTSRLTALIADIANTVTDLATTAIGSQIERDG